MSVVDRVQRRSPLWRSVHEVLLLGALWIVYTLGRAIAGQDVAHDAVANAGDLWAAERTLHVPSEAALQDVALHWDLGIRAANVYYKWEHWVTLVLVCGYVLLVRPKHYVWFRRVLVLTTALALVGHFLYPLAPPRLVQSLHITDTGALFGQSVYGDPSDDGLANQYAAMPSMHVAWAVLFAVAVIAVAHTRWRWLMVIYPVVTTYVVVVTGNHYWLDGVVGVALLLVALAVFRRSFPSEEMR